MSSTTPHTHDHEDDHLDHAPHGSLRGYLTGFILSVILTAIPFYLVMHGSFSPNVTVFTILALAVIQVVVHMIYFLHMNGSVEDGWSMMALIFTIVFVLITLTGSMWVLYNMNANMMPTSPTVAASAGLPGN